MSMPAAIPLPPLPSAASAHPWIAVLEAFSIPFICYGDGAQRTHVSPAALALVRGSPAGAALEQQADWVVRGEIGALRRPSGVGQFALVRRLPAPTASLLLAIHVAHPPIRDVAAVVILHPRDASDDRPVELTGGAGLSRRELEVARLIALGLSTKAIAARLRLSGHTVRHHTERIFTKLGVGTRAAVAAILARAESRPDDGA